MTHVLSYLMHITMTNVIFLFMVGALGFKHIWSQIYICKSWNMALIVVMLLLNHISSYIIHLFFIFSFLHLNFSSPYSPKKKKKPSSPYQFTPTLTFLPTFPLSFCLFIFPLLSIYCYTSFFFLLFWFFFSPFYFL